MPEINGYGKKPLWQWIVIYLVIGGIIYAAAYYFYFSKNGGYNYYKAPAQQSSAPSNTSNTVLMNKSDDTKGSYLAASNGMTLYIFDKDTKGVSNCYDTCATNWPPYLTDPDTTSGLPADLTVITRTDETVQYAWKGMPVYFYAKDITVGDTTGDGVGGIWHLAKP